MPWRKEKVRMTIFDKKKLVWFILYGTEGVVNSPSSGCAGVKNEDFHVIVSGKTNLQCLQDSISASSTYIVCWDPNCFLLKILLRYIQF